VIKPLEEKPYTGDNLNIFSMADGIGGAAVSLEKAGLLDHVKKYVRSEIDPIANAVFHKNWDDKLDIEDMGDARTIFDLRPYGVNMVMAGPPCQDFSRLVVKGLGLGGSKSSLAQHLFDLIGMLPPEQQRYIIEETAAMGVDPDPASPTFKRNWRDVIDEKLGVTGQNVDARNFSPQSRDRLWWAKGFPNELLPAKANKPDYEIYNKYIGRTPLLNPNFDPTDIFNHKPKYGRPWGKGLSLKDFDLSSTAKFDPATGQQLHQQDLWHSQVPWASAIIASGGNYNRYGTHLGKAFKRGRDSRFIVKADDNGNLIYDPNNEYTKYDNMTSNVEDPITGKMLPFYRNNTPAGNMDMIIGQPYIGRYPIPDEADILSGLPSGYTELPLEQIIDIIDKVNAVKSGKLEDHNISEWLKYSNLPGTGNNANIPPEDVAEWARYHNSGNGWQTDSSNYVLRRLFGLGGYDDDWSDERLKNIVPAIVRRF
jgi:site-specific DNA-cytosine methylase